MTRSNPNRRRRSAPERIAQLKERLCDFDFVCSGTLVKTMKTCGKAGCRCARDPEARHGPYNEWAYMKAGKQVHRSVSPEQAKLLRQAIKNYRTIRRLLRDWETQTVRVMDAMKRNR